MSNPLPNFRRPGFDVMTELPAVDPNAAPLTTAAQMGIKRANLIVTLRGRGATDIQVLVKPTNDKTAWQVFFRDKHTLRQWVMSPEACDALVSSLPEKFTYDELLAAIDAHEGALGVDHHARHGRVPSPQPNAHLPSPKNGTTQTTL